MKRKTEKSPPMSGREKLGAVLGAITCLAVCQLYYGLGWDSTLMFLPGAALTGMAALGSY